MNFQKQFAVNFSEYLLKSPIIFSKLPRILITEYLKFPKHFLNQFWNFLQIFVKNLLPRSANLLFWLAYLQMISFKNFRSLSIKQIHRNYVGEGGRCVIILKGENNLYRSWENLKGNNNNLIKISLKYEENFETTFEKVIR